MYDFITLMLNRQQRVNFARTMDIELKAELTTQGKRPSTKQL